MRKNSRTFIFIALLCIVLVFLYSSKLYYPPAPMESISKKELVSAGEEALNKLVYTTSENGHDWYIMSTDSSKSGSELIQQMAKAYGWQFIEQLGSGYIFERNGEQLIITTEMWSKQFQLVKVPAKTLE